MLGLCCPKEETKSASNAASEGFGSLDSDEKSKPNEKNRESKIQVWVTGPNWYEIDERKTVDTVYTLSYNQIESIDVLKSALEWVHATDHKHAQEGKVELCKESVSTKQQKDKFYLGGDHPYPELWHVVCKALLVPGPAKFFVPFAYLQHPYSLLEIFHSVFPSWRHEFRCLLSLVKKHLEHPNCFFESPMERMSFLGLRERIMASSVFLAWNPKILENTFLEAEVWVNESKIVEESDLVQGFIKSSIFHETVTEDILQKVKVDADRSEDFYLHYCRITKRWLEEENAKKTNSLNILFSILHVLF